MSVRRKIRSLMLLFVLGYLSFGIYLVVAYELRLFTYLVLTNTEQPAVWNSHDTINEVLSAYYRPQDKVLSVCVVGQRLGYDAPDEYLISLPISQSSYAKHYRLIDNAIFLSSVYAEDDCPAVQPADTMPVNVHSGGSIEGDSRYFDLTAAFEHHGVTIPEPGKQDFPFIIEYQLTNIEYHTPPVMGTKKGHHYRYPWPDDRHLLAVYHTANKPGRNTSTKVSRLKYRIAGIYYETNDYLPGRWQSALMFQGDLIVGAILAPVLMLALLILGQGLRH